MPDMRYTGDGAQFVAGVPARNMTAEEWAELPDDAKAAALATGLYKEVLTKKSAKKENEQ